MKEVNADEDLDSGQASEEDDEDQIKEKISKLPSKKWAGKRINGKSKKWSKMITRTLSEFFRG